MRVAYIHDWLVTYRGGEKVLESLLSLYPEAPLYTLFYDSAAMPESIRRRDIRVVPGLNAFKPLRKALLPILPAIIESLPLESYDLIISSSSCVAKGVLPGPCAKHLCYLHSPMRYIWDQRQHYQTGFAGFPLIKQIIAAASTALRLWDNASSTRVDQFVANSRFVADRVGRYYGRDAKVIYPPVQLNRWQNKNAPIKKGQYFLAAGALVPYKRFDLAIAACAKVGVPLVIAGSGPEEARLRRLASGTQTMFKIAPDDAAWQALICEAQALLFPGIEDFGLIAVEAIASGTPVIAYQAGGALDYIGQDTGLFFNEPTADCLAEAIKSFDASVFSLQKMTAFAQQFNEAHFLDQIRTLIKQLIGQGALK